MFILGLAVGPLIGLVAGDLAAQTRALGTVLGVALACLALIVLSLLPFLDQELRLGLLAGGLAGILLAVTPAAQRGGPEQSEERR